MTSYVTDKKIQEMRKLIPAHLNADEIIDNALINAGDTDLGQNPGMTVEDAFESTVFMYIDQDCSSF